MMKFINFRDHQAHIITVSVGLRSTYVWLSFLRFMRVYVTLVRSMFVLEILIPLFGK